MLKTMDIINSNIIQLMAMGMTETFVSMPVISMDDDGKPCLKSFCWSQFKKQRNVPAPEHIITTHLSGCVMTVDKAPECDMPSVVHAGSASPWQMKKLAEDLDVVINEYLTTDRFPTYKYLQYLENMIPCYSADYYPLFAQLNNKDWNIDILKEIED